jgi:hypothetical protein
MKVVLLALLLVTSTLALAATPKVITKLPFTITTPGYYLLNRDRVYSGTGNAITINTDNVTLDLGGNTITANYSFSQANETSAVFAENKRNITVRNGKVRFFARGIRLTGDNGGGHLVEDVQSLESTIAGMVVRGEASTVRKCRIDKVRGANILTAISYGLILGGRGSVAEENTIYDVYPNSTDFLATTYFIAVEDAPFSVISRNRVQSSGSVQGQTNPNNFAIRISNSRNMLLKGNEILNVPRGITFSEATGTNSGSLYRDNTAVGSTAPAGTAGVKDGGGNVN